MIAQCRLSSRLAIAAWLSGARCASITDPPTVERVVIAPAKIRVAVGDSVQLQATAYDGRGRRIERVTAAWSCSAPEVLRVDPVRAWAVALRPGETVVTATIRNTKATATAVTTVRGT